VGPREVRLEAVVVAHDAARLIVRGRQVRRVVEARVVLVPARARRHGRREHEPHVGLHIERWRGAGAEEEREEQQERAAHLVGCAHGESGRGGVPFGSRTVRLVAVGSLASELSLVSRGVEAYAAADRFL
jgi:hypothetical protein